MKTFTAAETHVILTDLNHWKFADDAIVRQFEFKNFSQSLAFIVQVGILAEKANHHPEIFNVYNKVKLTLSTHDAGGITQKDFDLASNIDKLF